MEGGCCFDGEAGKSCSEQGTFNLKEVSRSIMWDLGQRIPSLSFFPIHCSRLSMILALLIWQFLPGLSPLIIHFKASLLGLRVPADIFSWSFLFTDFFFLICLLAKIICNPQINQYSWHIHGHPRTCTCTKWWKRLVALCASLLRLNKTSSHTVNTFPLHGLFCVKYFTFLCILCLYLFKIALNHTEFLSPIPKQDKQKGWDVSHVENTCLGKLHSAMS